jgi:hypothetical protein
MIAGSLAAALAARNITRVLPIVVNMKEAREHPLQKSHFTQLANGRCESLFP